MFAELLNLGLGIAGATSASGDARRAQQHQHSIAQRQLEIALQQAGLERDAFRARERDNNYIRQTESFNRNQSQLERQYDINQYNNNLRSLQEQQTRDIERQRLEDAQQRSIADYRRQNLDRNQDLATRERQFGINQLQNAQSIAQSERQSDLSRLDRDRAQATEERDYLRAEYQKATAQALKERQQEANIRTRALGGVDALEGALQKLYDDFQKNAPTIDPISQQDITDESNRRLADYQGDVDRAADRVASVNEADLIRRGIDESSPADRRRADITAQIGHEYQNARNRAHTDALSYISGRSQALSNNANSILDLQNARLGQATQAHGTSLSALSQLPRVSSAVNAHGLANLIPSGVLNRNISSANNYRAPVGIGSAVTNGDQLSALSQYRQPTSTAYSQNIRSGITNPYNQNNQFNSSAANILNNLGSQANSRTNRAQDRAFDASVELGGELKSLVNDTGVGKKVDTFFGNLFGGGS